MKKSLQSFGSLLAIATVLAAPCAHAQSMDYSSLQDLFGESVTTSATGTPQRSSEVAANMTIITADQIRQSGSRDIPEIVGMYVSGVDILRTSYGDYNVGVRGLQQTMQPRLLVLVDGRQVFIDDYSRTIWQNIPVNLDDVRQIEVVKGPASALFGSNAASGVINIITYSPDIDNNNVVSARLGTQNTLTGDATVTKNGEWGGVKFSAGGLNADEFDTARAAVDRTPLAPYHRYVSAKSLVKLSSALDMSNEATYAESKGNGVITITNASANEDVTTYSIKTGLGWKSSYGFITAETYLNHSAEDLATASYPNANVFNTQLIVASLNDQFKVGTNHTVRLGLEYRHKDFDYTGASQTVAGSPKIAEDNFAASGTWLWQIRDNLSFTNSLRIDHMDMQQTGTLPATSTLSNSDFSHAINTVSANSAVVYKATDKDTFHASYGRGVQMPSMLQSGMTYQTVLSGFPTLLQANPDLKPVITQSYEVGYDRSVAEIFSTVKIASFYELVQSVAGQTLTMAMPLLIQPKNLGNSRGYGMEVGIDGSRNGFRWGASYSFSRITDDADVAARTNFEKSAPQHKGRVNVGYTHDKWEIDANSQAVSGRSMLRYSNYTLIPSDGYLTVGGRIGYNLTDKVSVALSGNNINHSYLTSSPYPAVERQAFLSLTAKF